MNCVTCSSSNVCSECSQYSQLINNGCDCKTDNCELCLLDNCTACHPSFSIYRNKSCLLKEGEVDALVVTTLILGAVASAFSLVTSILRHTITSIRNGRFWFVFNTLQMIELFALLDLNYPPRLEQFFHGFSFTLL